MPGSLCPLLSRASNSFRSPWKLMLRTNWSSITSSASEFAEILEILKSRDRGPYAVGPNMYAQDGSRIFHGGYGATTDVWALSPSAATVTNSLTNLAERLLTGGDCRRFKRFAPNDLSVAILGASRCLRSTAGSRLGKHRCSGIRMESSSKFRGTSQDASERFQIAHHGSDNADHDEIWLSMLVNQPTAVVTPYAKLIAPRPTPTDVQRIRSRTNKIYCTTWPPSRKPPRRRGVDGIIRGATKSRRALNKNCGYVRLRVDLSDSSATPTIELFESAKKL